MFTARNFADAHLIFQYKDNFILGVSSRGEYTAFGGRSERDETLMGTLVREYIEEAHEIIVPVVELTTHIHHCMKYLVQPRGTRKSFIGLIRINQLEKEFSQLRATFKKIAARATNTRYKEIFDIVLIPISEIAFALQKNDRCLHGIYFREPLFENLRKFVDISSPSQ